MKEQALSKTGATRTCLCKCACVCAGGGVGAALCCVHSTTGALFAIVELQGKRDRSEEERTSRGGAIWGRTFIGCAAKRGGEEGRRKKGRTTGTGAEKETGSGRGTSGKALE